MIGIESGKHYACAAFVRTTVVTIIPSPLQRSHGFGYNGIVRIHLSTWLVIQLEGLVHSVPRDVTLPSLDRLSAVTTSSTLDRETAGLLRAWGQSRNDNLHSTMASSEPKYCDFWEQQLRGIQWIDGSSCGDGYDCRFTG